MYNRNIRTFPQFDDVANDYGAPYSGRVCFENYAHGYDNRSQVIGPIFNTRSEAECFLHFLEFRCVELATCDYSLIDDLKSEFERVIRSFRSDFGFSDESSACEHLNDTQERSEREWPCNWTVLTSLYIEHDYEYDLTRVIFSDHPDESHTAVIVETSNEYGGTLLDSDHPFSDLFDVYDCRNWKPDVIQIDISDSNRKKYNIKPIKAVA